MPAANAKTPAELFDDFIKLEWQDIFRKEVDVRLDNGSRYVPNGGSQGVSLLRKNVNAFEEAIRLWSGPADVAEGGSKGYDRIVEQAGREYTWEWYLIDESRPWASSVPALVRERIEADLERRSRNADANAKARAEEAERQADAEDDAMIVSMNARRAERGDGPLSAEREASVRRERRERRARRSSGPPASR